MDKERVAITYKTADGKEICVEVTTEVKELLEQSDRQIRSQRRQDRQYLNFKVKTDDESSLLPVTEDTADLLERMERDRKLYKALSILTETQRLRIYLYYYMGMSYSQIGRIEGVNYKSVSDSINLALKKLQMFYEV